MKIRKIAKVTGEASKKLIFRNKIQAQKTTGFRILEKGNKIMIFWAREEVLRGNGCKLMIKTLIWLLAACFLRLQIEDSQLTLLTNSLNFLSLILYPETEPIFNNFGQLTNNILKLKVNTKIIIIPSMVLLSLVTSNTNLKRPTNFMVTKTNICMTRKKIY